MYLIYLIMIYHDNVCRWCPSRWLRYIFFASRAGLGAEMSLPLIWPKLGRCCEAV